MNSLQFKKRQFELLCSAVGSRPEELEYILDNIDDYYDEWFEKKVNKTTGDYKQYLDGTVKQRAIRPSLRRLKEIQTAIKDRILAPILLPANVHGGVKKKSNISNAKPHQGKKFQFTTDLQEFYPNIKNRQVFRALLSRGISYHFAHWLTKLTTWKGELPQGTPTSTHIANLVFLDAEYKLVDLCKKHNLTYTRYIDDLTISSQYDFKEILNEILEIVKLGGFKINYRKTQYKGRQTVTGIEVSNNFIDVPPKIKIKAAAEKLLDGNAKPYTVYQNAVRRTNKGVNSRVRKRIVPAQ